MPIPFDRTTVPTVGQPADILGTTIVVLIKCRRDGATIGLLNEQASFCPQCGAKYSFRRMVYDVAKPPKIELDWAPASDLVTQ